MWDVGGGVMRPGQASSQSCGSGDQGRRQKAGGEEGAGQVGPSGWQEGRYRGRGRALRRGVARPAFNVLRLKLAALLRMG